MKYLVCLVMILGLSSCSIVGPGQKAVHTFFGKPVSETGSGITPWIPFMYGVTKFDLRVQKHVIETSAASKDMQPLAAHVAVNWRIDATNLINFFRDVGDEDDAIEKIIAPAVNEVLKGATAKMTAEDIVGRRIELKSEIDAKLQDRLNRYGLKCDDVSIMDIQFSPEFVKAIEAKQIAEQETKQAEYVAQKAIKEAEAQVNRAQGEAKAQKLLQSGLTREMLQKLAIDKWDGHFPQVTSGHVPFLNLTVGQSQGAQAEAQ